jgi:hypothetical protein
VPPPPPPEDDDKSEAKNNNLFSPSRKSNAKESTLSTREVLRRIQNSAKEPLDHNEDLSCLTLPELTNIAAELVQEVAALRKRRSEMQQALKETQSAKKTKDSTLLRSEHALQLSQVVWNICAQRIRWHYAQTTAQGG